MATQARAAQGMRTFTVIWAGQLASTLGSGLIGFALGLWLYETTGSETLFAISMLVYVLPNIALAPVAGVVADRWDRRLVLILADGLAGLGTLFVAAMFFTGRLAVWHVYIAAFLDSAANTFQWPAYGAATSLLVPKEHLGRASGMTQIAQALGQLITPAAAGALYVSAGLEAIIAVDLATLLIALATLLAVRFPQPERSAEGEAARGSVVREALFGWQYIRARAGLLGLLTVFALTNFLGSLTSPLIVPLVMNASTPDVAGYVFSISGIGMLLGTLAMSAWGGPQRRIYGIVLFDSIAGLSFALMGLRPSVPLIAAALFVGLLTMPITNGCSQAIWQSKVATDVQGRVFSVRRMIAFSIMPLAYLAAGPLAEGVFEPLLMPGGALASTFVGQVLGVGQGRGTGLMFLVAGLLNVMITNVILIHPRIRRLELELPDALPEPLPVAEFATEEGAETAPVAGG